MTSQHISIWTISILTILAIIVRPRSIPEYIWGVAGAALLVVFGLVSIPAAAGAVRRGADVYMFLVGMLALAELARCQGVFAWLADLALRAARGSRRRLFLLVYGVGVAVTTFLSNDATAVVLTPAVIAVLSRTDADPMPYLYACAFVAGAASFILPISNPANLVVFGRHLPPLAIWLGEFFPAALAAVLGTMFMLYVLFHRRLRGGFELRGTAHALDRSGRIAFAAIAVSTAVLIGVTAFGGPIGISTLALGVLSTAIVRASGGAVLRSLGRGIAWSIVPLVAALFVIVQALSSTGALSTVAAFFHSAAQLAPLPGKLLIGTVVTMTDNLLNNLPVALGAHFAFSDGSVTPHLVHATLVAVDLGPNLAVTGSLATILWLLALRRARIIVTPWQFLRIGFCVLTGPLLLALFFVR
ncbi:MAG: SLC13 family permease [Candidatus Eremiobacteraeota bacterium]|nr:SLC13 family permease [Candidatus Eremiobacteraeota bacterium]